jgi:hypothetical protein
MQAHCADGVVVAGGYSVGEVDGDREEVVRIQGAVRTWFLVFVKQDVRKRLFWCGR